MINIIKVTKSFPGLFRPVINDISLYLERGDFCVFIGANGCGKSTLLKLISSEYQADSGAIKLSGDVAQVVQDVNLGTVPEMTLLENIALSEIIKPKLLFYKRYKDQILQKLKELDGGLEDYINQPLKMLSGGQRQMIATLMAIISGRQILLLDEHTSALDPKMQTLLMEYTHQQAINHGLTTIMITHKMDDAIKYGNRLIMLHQGKIVLDIHGAQKKAMTVQGLLTMFHQYEDQLLVSGGGNVN
ncbi:ATP-binding cassette domain-containing protein [Lawsonia intracellularis]|uniref:ABC transporter ATP-binding protein n=1 Tax=Lawsonia intracellularis (strain PHE/MN1-00) TaxID=363253 RepID=Q1MRA4_LAWIP|nr:ATP-binding cassette domain-containing protein [Lawsonia intracellularis]AGC49834.1 ABC transporter ATP-binding protein [Lawsonia intracellularis N343]KAA0205338.1 ABC transporter ATP-binding protein [Lawsonia intracellularis]MBZ3892128.1 ATP-binding cassette domain-containing protein [Lawsonia intracellularis]OMQ04600.1 ABC transporter ATP-binding protein [Lawsonia intracellularis]RBN32115.1 ATP-binding cassette domain-containing protein [Lawsonia intracellularis]